MLIEEKYFKSIIRCPDLFAIGRFYEAASDENFRLVERRMGPTTFVI
jgi:hypothetical protein